MNRFFVTNLYYNHYLFIRLKNLNSKRFINSFFLQQFLFFKSSFIDDLFYGNPPIHSINNQRKILKFT